MASFCPNCGFPQGSASAFCSKCGARQAVAPQQPAATPAAPSSGGGTILKIVLVVFVVVGLLGVAAIGGLWYVGHRVKQAVMQKAAENGVDLSTLTPPASRSNGATPKIKRMCGYLSKEEASRLVGEPIEIAEVKDSMCLYMGPPGLAASLAQQQAGAALGKAQAPGAKPSGMDVISAVDQMASTMGAQGGIAGSSGEYPLLMVGVDPDGRAQMTALAAANGIFGGILHAAEADQSKPGQPACTTDCFGVNIPGLGDRAIRLPKLGLNVLQGELLVRVIPGPIPDANRKTTAIARTVLGRL
jgi:hypothetical protein